MSPIQNFVKSRRLYMARHLLGDGLLTSEGDFHLRQRRLVQPAFHKQRIAAYAEAMTGYAQRLGERWQDGATVDMAQEMLRLTLGIVGKALFGADVESEANEISAALKDALGLFNRYLTPFAEILNRLPLPSNRRFERARARLDATIYRIIQERRATGQDRGDLLSMLLQARDEEGDGSGMTDAQVRNEAMNLFLAGHETTANALSWTWYLLSMHPGVEVKLLEELEEVLRGRLPTADDVPQLKYTRMVFAEAMRLYPPVWLISRQPVKDYQVGGYLVPAGSIVLMSPFLVQRDRRFYPDPYRFDPERWTPEAQAARPKFAYFPFGGGPRLCIGEPFAWMEGVLVLATLARDWHVRMVPEHPVALEPLITLRPKFGMRMVVERRKAQPRQWRRPR